MDEVLNIRISPATRIMWKFDRLGMKGEVLELAREIYLSELRTVAEGLRRCGTTHIRSECFDEDLNELLDLGLIFLPIRKCRRVEGFANTFYDPEPNQPYDVFGAVSRSLEYAREWREAYYKSDHYTMGELLGYPECCIKFFARTFPHEYDPVWSAAKNTKGAKLKLSEGCAEIVLDEMYAESNIMLRYFGLRAAPHITCSFTCEKSVEFAQKFLGFITKTKKKLLLELLSCPAEWDSYKGVAIIRTPYFIGAVDSVPYRTRHVVVYRGKT
jgi:hypothetical protein